MYGWKEEEIQLKVSLKDLARMARLPGKLEEYYISKLSCSETKDGISTNKDDQDDIVVNVHFARTLTHKTN